VIQCSVLKSPEDQCKLSKGVFTALGIVGHSTCMKELVASQVLLGWSSGVLCSGDFSVVRDRKKSLEWQALLI